MSACTGKKQMMSILLEEPQYVPLQPKAGDLAVYMQNSAIEIEFNNEKYVIVSQSSILLLVRDDKLFE